MDLRQRLGDDGIMKPPYSPANHFGAAVSKNCLGIFGNRKMDIAGE